MCSVNTLLCINDIFDARKHDQPARTLAKQLRLNHQVFHVTSHINRGVTRIFSKVRTILQMPLSPNPLLNVPKGEIIVSRSVLTVYSCFEKGCRKKCARDRYRKVIWDMINTLFVTTEAVEPTFVAFL